MTDTAKKRPDMAIYFVPERDNAHWVQIGAAWQHRDGDGYALRFDLMPSSPGDIVLRKPKPKAEQTEQAEAST